MYKNKLFWTPRFYQASHLTTEFENELLKFKNIHAWEDKHVLALTQLILIEATRDTTFDVSFQFRARPSPICQFNGTIDALLYQRYGDLAQSDLAESLRDSESGMDDAGVGFPLIPVFFPVQRKRSDSWFVSESFPLS